MTLTVSSEIFGTVALALDNREVPEINKLNFAGFRQPADKHKT